MPPAGATDVYGVNLVGSYAVFPRESASEGVVDGSIWKPPNTTEKLVNPGSELVYDIRSDGNTLAWVQAQSKDPLTRAAGDLWTSPFATTAAGIKPEKRRPVPAISIVPTMKGMGDGWYALVEQPIGSKDRYLHVYRLTDVRHWKVQTPADVRPTNVVYIDGEEVWYTGTTMNDSYNTLVRQQLSALGPGD